tara:strand:- start:38 stop:469 length:432 start_codon:yes stop_codon:yes gene_type:complete
MNNNYNPMNPMQDTLQKYQWSVHTIKRSSSLFKHLNKDNWSCAGLVNNNSDTFFHNETSLCFYWRKPIVNTDTFKNPFTTPTNLTTPIITHPIFQFKGLNNNSRSNCSTPAREVEEQIVCDDDDDDDDTDHIDTFFDSFNKND